ncbi:MAG: thiamine phosphate synthase [Candidatus Saganbacteria bacterium]|nr:thiamine phosphate synthase [Candidatus Saganbacteria bacterium]
MRIIDVNLNRATEGLRVVEEICRFILEDAKLTLAVKQLRGRLSQVMKHELASRDAAGDVGREPYTKNEKARNGIAGVFLANIKRAQEAARCLEEFSKLLKPVYGKSFKVIRFEVYQLEKKIAPKLSKALKLDFDLYVVTHDPRAARRAIARGVKIIQYRDKRADKKSYLKTARKLAALAGENDVAFILNDHWELVGAAGADGVNVGQEDLKRTSFCSIRKKLGADAIIGVSVASLAQARRAQKLGADYVGVGPVFSTPVKKEAKAVGLKELRRIVGKIKIPVVAIGGVNKANVRKVLGTGCSRVAAIRAAGELARSRQRIWRGA